MAHSPVSPPSPVPGSHLQESPNSDYSASSSNFLRKRQRIYQSISLAFSKNKSPMACSSESFQPGFPEAMSSSDNQEPILGAQNKMQNIEWMNSESRGDGGDQEENQRQEPVITEETVAVQPWSKLDSLFGAAERQLDVVKGPFVPPPTIEEVTLAHRFAMNTEATAPQWEGVNPRIWASNDTACSV